jgi:hypothetical protein
MTMRVLRLTLRRGVRGALCFARCETPAGDVTGASSNAERALACAVLALVMFTPGRGS